MKDIEHKRLLLEKNEELVKAISDNIELNKVLREKQKEIERKDVVVLILVFMLMGFSGYYALNDLLQLL